MGEIAFAPGTFQGLHQSEVELFQRVLNGVSGVGVEIGCCDGFSSAHILAASELHLTSIDPFIPDSMEASLVGSKERYLKNVMIFDGRARLVEGYSHEPSVIEQFTKNGVSLIFIDGDHRYEEAKKDFDIYSELLPVGGLLAMHDARMGREGSPSFHEGPSQVAREHVFGKPDAWDVIGEAFSLVVARKR